MPPSTFSHKPHPSTSTKNLPSRRPHRKVGGGFDDALVAVAWRAYPDRGHIIEGGPCGCQGCVDACDQRGHHRVGAQLVTKWSGHIREDSTGKVHQRCFRIRRSEIDADKITGQSAPAKAKGYANSNTYCDR